MKTPPDRRSQRAARGRNIELLEATGVAGGWPRQDADHGPYFFATARAAAPPATIPTTSASPATSSDGAPLGLAFRSS